MDEVDELLFKLDIPNEPKDYNAGSLDNLWLNDPAIIELMQECQVIENDLTEFHEAANAASRNATATENEMLELRRSIDLQLAELREAKKRFDQSLYQNKRDAAPLEDQLKRKQDEIERLKRAKIKAGEFKLLEDRWDHLTMGAPWRELAKPHQIDGAKNAAFRQKMIIADPMGLGKTLTALITLDMAKVKTKGADSEHPVGGEEYVGYGQDRMINEIMQECGLKVLYFCPATMTGNVQREIELWAPYRTPVNISGIPKAGRYFALNMLKSHSEYVVICNYEAWRKDLALIEGLIDIDFDTVIIDEAHNIKDRKSIAYRGINQILEATEPPFVFPMTGTPILNRPQELFSLLTLVAPHYFYDERIFLRDYCKQNDNYKWIFKPGGLESLSKRIAPYFMRRTKDQAGIVLPPMAVIEHVIEVDELQFPEQARARNEMRKWGSIKLDPGYGEKKVTALNAISVIMRLRQVETWPAGIVQEIRSEEGELLDRFNLDVEQSQKLDEIIHYDFETQEWEGILPEVVNGERVVIYSQFLPVLKELQRRSELAGITAAMMVGETPQHKREEILKDFDAHYAPENPRWQIVLCHYKVGGVGANFTDASQMIIADEEWNPGKRDQAYGRIDRMGQTRPTTVHVLRVKGTIDKWLADLIAEKEAMVGGFESVATEMAQNLLLALKNGEI